MMDQSAMAEAMAKGAPITCASCRHFHEGNMYCGKTECGGPGSGNDFPLYDGPIPREKFAERCLICGNGEVQFNIVLGEGKTKYSLCAKHRQVFEYVGEAPGQIKHPVTLIAVP